jgi:hypothetical protein
MRVKELRQWLREHGGPPPYLSQMRKHELIEWIERYERQTRESRP